MSLSITQSGWARSLVAPCFAGAVIAKARAYGAQVLINSDIELAQRLGADGVHLTVVGQQRLAKAVLKDIEKDWLPDGLPSPSPSPAASSSASAAPSI